jgi:hypothetical protein
VDTYKVNSYDVLPGMVLEFPALYVSVSYVYRDHEEEQVTYSGLVILRDEVVKPSDLEDKVVLPTSVPGVHFADDVLVIGTNWDFSVGRFADIVCDRRVSLIEGWAPGRRRKGDSFSEPLDLKSQTREEFIAADAGALEPEVLHR